MIRSCARTNLSHCARRYDTGAIRTAIAPYQSWSRSSRTGASSSWSYHLSSPLLFPADEDKKTTSRHHHGGHPSLASRSSFSVVRTTTTSTQITMLGGGEGGVSFLDEKANSRKREFSSQTKTTTTTTTTTRPTTAAKNDTTDTPDTTDHFSVRAAYGWLYRGLKRNGDLSSMAAVTLLMAGESVAGAQPALFLGRIVDAVGVGAEVWPLFAAVGASVVVKEACTIGRKYAVEKSATSLQRSAFSEQAAHLLSVRVDALQDQRAGSLVVRLDKSVEGLLKLQKVTFLEGGPSAAAAVAALSYACAANPALGGTMAAVVAANTAVTAWQISSQKGIRIDLNERKAEMGAGVVDLLNNLGYVRAAGMREREHGRLDATAERVRKTEFRHHKYMMSFSALKNIIEQAGFVAVVGGAVSSALAGHTTGGEILTLAMLYSKATQPLQQMHKVVDQGHEAVVKVGILGPIRALPTDPGLDGTVLPKADATTALAAKGLTLRRGDRTVLRDAHLEIRPGEIVGVAGPSGSGKSTLLECALGLVPDYEGSLTVLDAEARDADRRALARATAYARQEPFVLTGTVRENLTATDAAADGTAEDDDALRRALRRASLDDLPLDALVREAGRNLSGGQRQRLALARVMRVLDSGRARLAVLDEATSALDNATEARVVDALHELARERKCAVIAVAHRLSTLRRTDRVLVVDEGRVVQDGPYDELAREEGPFRDLLRARTKS